MGPSTHSSAAGAALLALPTPQGRAGPLPPGRSEVRSEVARAVPQSPGALRADVEQVFRRDYPAVLGVARRVLGDREGAEDVAQEVFLSFARSSVPAEQSRGWLCVAAAHTALNAIRSGQRRTARETAAATRDVPAPDPADEVLAREERGRVLTALQQIPRNQAVALVLRHSGLSYAEVADALGISPTSVGTTVRRAESALREELNRHAPSL